MVRMMARDQRRSQRRTGLARARRALAACTILWMTCGAVPAAMAVDVASNPDAQKPIFQWLFSLVMVGVVCVIAFKNPKRTHQA